MANVLYLNTVMRAWEAYPELSFSTALALSLPQAMAPEMVPVKMKFSQLPHDHIHRDFSCQTRETGFYHS